MPEDDGSSGSSDLLRRLRAALHGRYEVERELGRGGMGTVFLARDLRHGRLVAIKVLDPDLAPPSGAKRFLAEILTAANLPHPNIVTVYESGEAAGLPYYVMPYIEGESLRDRLTRTGALAIEESVRIAIDVAEALDFAHQRGVVHRDVKPENILVADHGRASVADFGIARAVSASAEESLTRTGLILGSPPYMSPEQADQATVLDGRADIYSLGCVLHEMLAGAPPFGANGAKATILRHLTEEPAPLQSLRPEVPPLVEAAVLKALAKEPGERFGSSRELAATLEPYLHPPPPGATSPGAPAAAPPGAGSGRSAQSAESARGWLPEAAGVRRRRGARTALRLGVPSLGAAAVLTVLLAVDSRPTHMVGVGVLPFSAGGGAPSVPDHREFAASLQLLPFSPALRVLDGRALLAPQRDWREVPLPTLLERFRRQGAAYLVVGDLSGAWPETHLLVQVYATATEELVYAGANVAGELPERALDRIGLEMARELSSREPLELEVPGYLGSATTSLVALTRLMRGQEHFGRHEVDEAAAAFRRAVEADSLCGLCYYRLAVAETTSPRWDYPAALAAIEAGLQRGDSMAPRWVQLLKAQRNYVTRNADSAAYQFQRIVGDHPDLPDARLGLAEVLYHYGGALGVSPTAALPEFQRLVGMDSTFASVADHMIDLVLHLDDAGEARRSLARIPQVGRSEVQRTALTLHFGDAAARTEAFRRLSDAERSTISLLIAVFAQEALDLRLVDTLASLLVTTDRDPEDRLRGAQYRLVALAAQGRWAEARSAWLSVGAGQDFDSWLVQAYLAGYPAEDLVEPMLAWARAQVAAGRAPDFTPMERVEVQRMHLRDAFRALVHLATLRGDSSEVSDLLRRLDAAAPQADPTDPEPVALRASLQARLSLLAGDTTRAIEYLRRVVTRTPWTTSWFLPLTDVAPQRLLLAELLAARGNVAAARRQLDSFGKLWFVGDALYLGRAGELRARLDRGENGRNGPGARERTGR